MIKRISHIGKTVADDTVAEVIVVVWVRVIGMELQVIPAGQVCVIICVIVLTETTAAVGRGKEISLRNSATPTMAEIKVPKYDRVSAVERKSVLPPVFRGNQITKTLLRCVLVFSLMSILNYCCMPIPKL
jgi:hypothetical protein